MRRVTDRRWWSLGAIALVFALLALASPTTAAANVAPQCDAGLASQVLRTGKPMKLRVYCSDADLDALTIAHSSPDHGTLGAFTFNASANAYEATFTPAASYTGPDDFNFTASDGTVTTPTYGFNLIITENHAPRCEPTGAVHTKVDEAALLNVFCSDQDAQDQDLTYTTIAGQGPDHGSLGPVTDLTVEYTPNSGFSGADHFTIRASDGTLADTYSQVVHVANTPLCATPPAVQIRSGSGRFLAVDCTRPADDTGTARYEIGTPPTQGTISPSSLSFNPERFYEADSGASGADAYTVRMTSSSGASPYVTQAITTGSAINHAPVCDVDAFDRQTVHSDRPAELGIFCTDLDDDPIAYAAAGAAEHGASETRDGQVIYTAEADYIGFDEVPFGASDGHGGTTSGSFPVNVHAPEAPSCVQGAIAKSVRPGSSVRLELACSSPQGDAQTYSATAPSKGTLGAFDPDGGVTYTADAGQSGPDTFTLRADNPVGQSDPQPVTITIDASFNRAPQCNENPFTPKRVVKNTPRALDLGSFCSDPDGDALVFERRSDPSHGSVTAGPAETLTYTPATDYLGPDSFTYVARDDRGVESAVATFSVSVVASNAPTCAAPAPITVRPSQAKSIVFSCSDPDAEQLTYRIVTPPSGTLSPPGDSTNPVRVYTAPASAGSDSFSYRAVSPGGESVVRTQQITVDPNFNSTPTCTPNSGFPDDVVQGRATQLPIATWCEDADGDPLSFARALPDPQHGTATASNGVITYTSDPGWTGPDSIGYVVSDGHGGTLTQTYTVNVVAPVAPTCETPDPVDVRTGAGRTVELRCFDDFGDELSFEITDPPDLGTLDPPGDGTSRFRAYVAGGAEGDDAFSYRATSANGTSNVVTQVLHLGPEVNVAPSCLGNAGFPEPVAGGDATTLDPGCSDDDGDELSYTKLSEPAHGTLSDTGGTLVYTPAGGYSGPDQFSYKASDGHGGESAPTTYHVDVVAADAPTCAPSEPVTLRPNTARTLAFDCDAVGGGLTYVIDTPPALGELSGSGASRLFTAGNEEGDASFTWHAHSTAAGDSATQTQTITVDAGFNVAPTCPTSITVAAEAGAEQTVEPACSDDDGDSLSFAKQSEPAHGTLTDSGGVLRYTAATGYSGTDSFTYRAADGHGGQSGIGTVTLNVTNTNQAPACTGGPFDYEVESGAVLTLPDPPCTDADGETLSYEIVTPPAHGTLGAPGAGGGRTYTPDAGYTGEDSFTFQASDGVDQSSLQTVSITVTPPPNDPPACSDVSRTLAPEADATIQLACTDPDGDPVTLEPVAGPAHGTLGAIDQGTDQVVYTPEPGYTGTDSFTYRATDGTLTGPAATVSIVVTGAPACEDIARTTEVATAVSVPLTCSDPDGDVLTLSIVSSPSKGTLDAMSGGAVTYTPDAGEFGSDSFTYRASDGTAQSAPATVSITITRAPSCDDLSRTTAVGAPVPVPLSCTDADGDALTLSIVDGPSKGTLGAISGGAVTYTPGAGESGADSFRYRASDGSVDSLPATVSITITRAPSCDDVSRTTAVDSAVSVPLTCTDPDGDALTLSIMDEPSKGSLGALSGGAVTYTPDAGAFGGDSFTYRATDGTAESALATASITITRAPSCEDATVRTEVGVAVQVPLECTDPDGDALTLSIVDAPSTGSLGPIASGEVTYTPDAGELGPDSFTFRASDGTAESAPATVSITTTRAPSCDDVARTTPAAVPVSVPLTCTDPDGDALTLSIVDGPSKGSLGPISGGAVIYTPDAGEFGPDSFTYVASDGTADSDRATVSITITRAPSCEDATVSTEVGTAVQVPLECTDPDGDALTLSIVDGPSKGSLSSISGGAVTYTPAAGEFGADAFTYEASDGTAGSEAATVDVTITRPPACQDVGETALVGSSVSVPLSCSDPDGDALALAIADGPSQGSLGAISADSVTYTPEPDAAGQDTFTFTASDGTAESAPATVTITLTGAPHCADVSRTTAVGAPVSVSLSCSDPDGDPLALSIVNGPSKGALGAISGGAVTYTPDAGEFGADSFTYRANDGTADSAPATVSITITRPPSCEDVSVRTSVATAVQVPLECTDPDGDAVTVSIVDGPSKGSLSSISGGAVTYTPAAGEFGADTFTYRASDGTAESAPATVNVTITRPPSCQDIGETVRVGSSVSVPLTCSDPEGDPLALEIVDGPSQGTLGAISGASVTYTPDAVALGEDTFTFRASDGAGESPPATATITLTGPPRCDAVSRRTRVATPVAVPLTCEDPDGDSLALSIGDGPAKGTLGPITAGTVTYTPAAGEHGTDTFTYTANDGEDDSVPATATITITRAPSCSDATAKTAVGEPVEVPLSCTDEDGDTLALAKASDPAKGTLGAFSATAVTYTPDAGEFGADSFTYRADDGDGDSAPATVSITITRPPACDAVTADTPAGDPVEIDLSCTDPDGDAVTLSTVAGPDHGSLGSIAGAKLTYTPDAGYSGPDSFTYRGSDGTADSAPATVTLTVIPPPNQAPSCEPVAATTQTGTAVAVTLDCADPEDDALDLEIVGEAQHGSLGAVSGGTVTYTPDPGYAGADSFSYRASDGDLESSPATATLAVQAPPEVSLAVDRATAVEGSTLLFTATGSDADGTVEAYRYTVDGTVVQTGAARTLSRRFDAPGSHTVVVRATDDDGRTATASRTVAITAKPGEPTGGGGPSAPPPGPGPSGPAPDTSPPAASLKAAKQKLKAVLAKGLALTAACSEPCTLKLQLVVDKRTAKKLRLGKKPTVIGTLTRSLAGSAQLRVKLTSKAKRALKRAKSVKLSVRAVATDAAGNAATTATRVTLKR